MFFVKLFLKMVRSEIFFNHWEGGAGEASTFLSFRGRIDRDDKIEGGVRTSVPALIMND